MKCLKNQIGKKKTHPSPSEMKAINFNKCKWIFKFWNDHDGHIAKLFYFDGKTFVTLVLNPGLKKSQFYFSNVFSKKTNENYSPSVSQCVELG